MNNRRIYPRINTQWPVIFFNRVKEEIIGYVNNVSLNGMNFSLKKKNLEDFDNYSILIKIRNPSINPSELEIKGFKKWSMNKNGSIDLGIELNSFTRENKSTFIKYLNRKEELNITLYFNC